MHIWLSVVLAATPSPSPSVDPAETFYSPGTIGFIATFLVAAGAIVLIFDMVRRIRRVRYRSDIAAKLETESLDGASSSIAKPAAGVQPGKAAAKPAARAKPDRPAPPSKPKRD